MKLKISSIATLVLAVAAHSAFGAQQNAKQQGSKSGPCQLAPYQTSEQWPLEIEYAYKNPSWSSTKSAAALLLEQAQYFKTTINPFAKTSIPAELAFYLPNIRLKLMPYVTYAQTIDGRSCAQVVGAKLVINHEPEIELANELAAKNCVSRAALRHQMKHDQAVIEEIKEWLKTSNEVKAAIFTTYEKQGAAGRTADDISRQLVEMEKMSTPGILAKLNEKVKVRRRETVETRANLTELYSSCNGDFEKASRLAKLNAE